jgi:O-antigen/teichoic acid export membrane protein
MAKSSQTNAIVNALGIFTGVQFLSILCRLISNKAVAIFVGPVGIGLLGLYTQAIDMLTNITQLGVNQSGVREISAAAPADQKRLILIVRRWTFALGIFGALLTLAIAPLLSRWSFGNDAYTWAFRLLSITIFFTTLTNGEAAILQGVRRLRRYAVASLWGVMLGVACSVPVYYLWRVDGVVPCVILVSLSNMVALVCAAEKGENRDKVTLKETLAVGRRMIVLGFYLTISYAITSILAYVFRTYLNTNYDTVTVGHFQAGYTIINNYFGIIFTSLAVEYFPRLSANIHNSHRSSILVSHEISIVLWILIVVATLFVTFADLGVQILYSSEFLAILPFITLAMIGVLFKAFSWCLAFVMLARADGKIYMITEISSDIIGIILYVIGFSQWGFAGLGIAYSVWFVLYTIMTAIIYRSHYHMIFGKNVGKLLVTAVVIVLLSILAKEYAGWWASLLISLATVYPAYKHVMRR